MQHTQKPGSQGPANPYSPNYHSLSAKDLLDARDQFHVHLAHKVNVFATAIGRYLIRNFDPDSHDGSSHLATRKRAADAKPRTLENSCVQDWSWPCILVFVKQWQSLEDLRDKPEDVVPPFVYMPDGRIVAVCVVLAGPASLSPPAAPARIAQSQLGIGSPLYVEAQGTRRMGTAACMVSDGSDFYLLTNTHLAGQPGRPVRALLRGIPALIGTTQGTRHLTERTFSDIYPGLPGRDSVVNIDAAIVRLEDTHFWDAQTIDKPLGTVADFSADTASLSWIGWPVVAHGAASGEMCGEIKAIFYRYKSVGGRDYVADFVIGSRSDKPLVTQPGDSGALWCIDGVFQENTLSPVAIEWGGQRVTSGADADTGFLQLSLSTSMAVILRELSLDVVQDPAAERTQYWGPVGHYKIGQQACFLISDQNLRNFFTANLSDISFTTDQQIQTATHLQAAEFVPLSDVPDVVWKTNINRVKREVTRPMENWNHYADIDLPGADGKTLLEHYLADESSVDWSQWTGFYKTAPLPSASTQTSNSWGALPFRVWQIFASMVDFARSGDGASFLTAAGCLAHYIGDACQPLHGSQHSDGLNGATTGVHSTYEDNMVDAFADQIAAGFDSAVANLSFRPREIHTPRDAAMTIMDLMNFCHTVLPPEKICEVYNQARPGLHKSATKSSQVLDALWAQCGQETIEVIAAGAVTLAAVWQAAYSASGQSDTAGWLSETFDGTRDLMPIYEEQDFLRSLHLEFLGQSDLPGSDAPDQPPTPPPAGPSTAGTNPVHLDDRGHRAGGAAVPTKAPKSRTAKTPIPGARKSVKRPSKTTHRTAGRD